MQQAARVADYTAFFHLGKLIEYDETETIFVNPHNKKTEDYITGDLDNVKTLWNKITKYKRWNIKKLVLKL